MLPRRREVARIFLERRAGLVVPRTRSGASFVAPECGAAAVRLWACSGEGLCQWGFGDGSPHWLLAMGGFPDWLLGLDSKTCAFLV